MKKKWYITSPKQEADNWNSMLKVSPWSGHRNFVYDLLNYIEPEKVIELGTHYGCSFFAMCQSIKDKKLNDTEIFAVDTWEGDEQAGYYGEDVWIKVNRIKEEIYKEVNAKLLRMYFDEANKLFENETFDLIHIDGLHTYEAVSHDFAVWLPKLKKNGIMLFHDIYSDLNYGSDEFWKEILQKYTTYFEFRHSWGLGVLFPKGDFWYKNFLEQNFEDKIKLYEYKAISERKGLEVIDLTLMADERYKAIQSQSQLIEERDRTIQTQKEMCEERYQVMEEQKRIIQERDKMIQSQARLCEERYTAIQEQEGMIRERDEVIQAQAKLCEERYTAIQEQEGMIKERDETIQAQEKLCEERYTAIQEQERMIEERDEVIQAQEKLCEERYTAIQEQERMIGERDEVIQAQEKLCEERYTAIQEQERMIEERDEVIQAQASMCEERYRAIQEQENMIKERDMVIKAQANMCEERYIVMQEQGNIIAEKEIVVEKQIKQINELKCIVRKNNWKYKGKKGYKNIK